MREFLPLWHEFLHAKVSPAKAKTMMKGNAYKLELIKEIVKSKKPITFYTAGPVKAAWDNMQSRFNAKVVVKAGINRRANGRLCFWIVTQNSSC